MLNKRTVHIVDDDEAVCEALGLILGRAGYTVQLHPSARAFLEILPDASAGCIVTDIRMSDMDGFEFQKRLQALGVTLPLIMITGRADVSMAVSALKAGAFDFVEKSVNTAKLLAAVAAALDDRARSAGRSAVIEHVQSLLSSLSVREREVLDGLLAGRPNKAIALDLGVSPRTIEVYRAKLMLKMHAESLAELVRMTLMSIPDGGSLERMRN